MNYHQLTASFLSFSSSSFFFFEFFIKKSEGMEAYQEEGMFINERH